MALSAFAAGLCRRPPRCSRLGEPIALRSRGAGCSIAEPNGACHRWPSSNVSSRRPSCTNQQGFHLTNVSAAPRAPAAETPNSAACIRRSFAQNGQDRKLAFVSARRQANDHVRSAHGPASPFIVSGNGHSALLITAFVLIFRQVTAQVTENVYDSQRAGPDDPAGRRLIGTLRYSQVAFGHRACLWSGPAHHAEWTFIC